MDEINIFFYYTFNNKFLIEFLFQANLFCLGLNIIFIK